MLTNIPTFLFYYIENRLTKNLTFRKSVSYLCNYPITCFAISTDCFASLE